MSHKLGLSIYSIGMIILLIIYLFFYTNDHLDIYYTLVPFGLFFMLLGIVLVLIALSETEMDQWEV